MSDLKGIQFNLSITPPFEKVANLFRTFSIGESVQKGLAKIIYWIERYAKQLTPVDTGRLRASLGGGAFKGGKYEIGTGISIKEFKASIGSNVKYAKYVHGMPFYPIQRMRSRPFLTTGVELAMRKLGGEPILSNLGKSFRQKFKQL